MDNPDAILLQATNMIRDAISPDLTLFTECATETHGRKNIVVITVQRGTACPYYIRKKGIRPEGVYVRQGAASVPASETAIFKMIRETSGGTFEDARSLNQELSFERTATVFAKKGVEFGEAQKRSLNLIGADGMFSNLGMLLSDQCVSTTKIAVFNGSKKSVFRDRQELSGSILAQLEDAVAFLERYNCTRSEFSGIYRVDRRDYPSDAIREALLNAVVHRDYAISASTLISIFDDRIEIVTVGGLTRGITYGDIMLGVSVLRNRHLANVFYRLKLIEAYGTGMLKINESYADYAVKPKIEISDNAFKVTLPNVNFATTILPEPEPPIAVVSETQHAPYGNAHHGNAPSEREATLLQLLKTQGAIVRKDVETTLGVSQATAVLILREMLRKNLIVKIGNGKLSSYRSAP